MVARSILIPLCSALALSVTACNAGPEPAPTGPPTTPTVSKKESEAQKSGDAVEVVIENTEYVPMEVSVPAGGTITWTNEDDFPHTVTKEGGPGPEFDSGEIDGGETFEQTFKDAGTIDYVCTIHPSQTGTITVEKR